MQAAPQYDPAFRYEQPRYTSAAPEAYPQAPADPYMQTPSSPYPQAPVSPYPQAPADPYAARQPYETPAAPLADMPSPDRQSTESSVPVDDDDGQDSRLPPFVRRLLGKKG